MPKHYDQGYLKNFLLLSILPVLIELCGKSAHFGSKMSVLSKNSNQQNWKFPKVTLWPKPNIQNSAYTKPINLEL